MTSWLALALVSHDQVDLLTTYLLSHLYNRKIVQC
jgi:hypothetical protein